MNIKPMLVPLEGAIDRNDLIEQMVLLPEPASAAAKWSSSTKSVNLVVAYNASPKSQTALDLTMWIAHQTRSVTQQQVTVQVVYVVDEQQNNNYVDECESVDLCRPSINRLPLRFLKELASKKSATLGLTNPQPQRLAGNPKKRSAKRQRPKETLSRNEIFEQADRILWQARCLAEEWRGSFKAHLRFGDVATELKEVVESESATLLLLGCNCANHPIVRQLASDSNLPCAVLGIPKPMSADITL